MSDCDSSDVCEIPTFPPHDIRVDCEGWQAAAIESLRENGFVALRGASLSDELCERCAKAAHDRLDRLLDISRGRGFDPETCALRFKEVCKRIPRDMRFDIRLPHMNIAEDGEQLQCPEADLAAWAMLHEQVHCLAWPVLESVLKARDTDGRGLVSKSGCVIAMPGASGQPWHPDGYIDGIFNVFVPLVPITPENGPTEFQPGSQVLVDPEVVIPLQFAYSDAEVDPVAPCAEAGDVIIFDYRVTHRGLGNRSAASRPVGYLTYSRPGVEDDYSFPTESLL